MSEPATTARTAAQPPAEDDSVDPALSDDRELVAALQAGEPEAVSRLIERYGAVVFGLCLRMLGHRQDAEDLSQETFLRAVRAVHGFEGDRPLRPWLLGIAANRCRTALGKRARRPVVSEIVDRADPRPPPAPDLAGELEIALARLRPEYRLVFILFHEQGLPYEEISRSIDRPIGTVKTWLHRARAELAEYLSRRGVTEA